jgi:hypothetical protein
MKRLNGYRMKLVFIGIVAAIVLGGIEPAKGATIVVGPGAGYDFDSIQAGIDAANGGDTVLVAPGEYVITEPITFQGKAITVRSEAGHDMTTIRMGTSADPNRASVVIFENNETAASVLEGFTLTGGRGCWRTESYPPRKSWWLGGGIYCSSTSPTIVSCTMIQNTAEHGGGMFAWEDSSPILANCIIKDNSATETGGGLFLGSRSLTMTDCIIRGNSAGTSSSMWGSGGGIFFYKGSSLIMTDCITTGNTAHYGGGIKCEYGLSATLTRCIIADNTSGTWGGGLEVVWGSAAVTNCVIARNSAVSTGGGMWCGDGSVTVTNSIFWANTAPTGREISLEVTSVLDITCSDVAGGEICVYVDDTSTLNWGAGNIDADPLFARLGYWDDNGTRSPEDDVWVDGDYHLKSQAGRWDSDRQTWIQDDVISPCIDVGDLMSPIGLEPFPNGGFVNMGTYGGTPKASKSYFGEPVCETIVAGDINGDGEVNRVDLEIMALHWTDEEPLPLP